MQELELFHSRLSSFTLEARIPQNEETRFMARLPYASQTGFSEDTARAKAFRMLGHAPSILLAAKTRFSIGGTRDRQRERS